MNEPHLTEDILQDIAAGDKSPDAQQQQHLAACVLCRQQLSIYHLTFQAVEEQPAVSFDFDVAALVMAQIPDRDPENVPEKNVSWVFALLVGAIVAIGLYLFRRNISYLGAGISSGFLGISMLGCGSIVGFKLYRMIKSYQRKLQQLNMSA